MHAFWLICVEQKWSKGKVRDKLNNLVLFDKATYDKLYKEVPSYKLITPAVVSERLKIRGSLARAALKELQAKGNLQLVAFTHSNRHYNDDGCCHAVCFLRATAYMLYRVYAIAHPSVCLSHG